MSRTPKWHKAFLAMLPKIRKYASFAFRHLKPEARAENVAEVIANAWKAFVGLVQQNKVHLAFPTVLARYGVKQVRDGRKVGGHLNIKDLLSFYCQSHKHVKVERLDRFNDVDNCWEEAVVQDTRSLTVPEVVAFRLDFADWLKSLKRRDRRIAEFLSLGNRTSDAARKFRVSDGRVSQLRKELADSWSQFVGDYTTDTTETARKAA